MERDLLADLPLAVATILDDDLRGISSRTLLWAQQRDVRPSSDRRQPSALAVVASVYALYCAPPSPTPESLDIAARFIMLFLCVDDADDQDVPGVVLDDASALGALGPAFDAWRREFTELGTCAPSLREHFEASFVDYLRARKTEAELASRALSLEEHWTIRRATIFMEPYIDQWMISTAIDPGSFELTEYAVARRLCIDLVLLANDLGSVARDDERGDAPTDLNLVHAYERERGLSTSEAVDHVVALYDEMASHFESLLVLDVDAPAGARAYAELLRELVDGNLRALGKLAFRYPGAEPTLARLHRPGSRAS